MFTYVYMYMYIHANLGKEMSMYVQITCMYACVVLCICVCSYSDTCIYAYLKIYTNIKRGEENIARDLQTACQLPGPCL